MRRPSAVSYGVRGRYCVGRHAKGKRSGAEPKRPAGEIFASRSSIASPTGAACNPGPSLKDISARLSDRRDENGGACVSLRARLPRSWRAGFNESAAQPLLRSFAAQRPLASTAAPPKVMPVVLPLAGAAQAQQGFRFRRPQCRGGDTSSASSVRFTSTSDRTFSGVFQRRNAVRVRPAPPASPTQMLCEQPALAPGEGKHAVEGIACRVVCLAVIPGTGRVAAHEAELVLRPSRCFTPEQPYFRQDRHENPASQSAPQQRVAHARQARLR